MNKSVINTADAPAPIGPYNQAIRIENTLYVSGQIAIEPASGDLITGDIESETRQVMTNIGKILEASDLDFSHVVKCTIFVKDMNNFARVNDIYGGFFSENAPARETVEVCRLPKDVNVEISCVAVG